jgi:hypothetical protein
VVILRKTSIERRRHFDMISTQVTFFFFLGQERLKNRFGSWRGVPTGPVRPVPVERRFEN